MRTSSKVACFNCGKEFDKPNSEINRTVRLGKHHFCSLSCSVTYKNQILPSKGNPDNLDAGNRLDEFSPFRYLFRTAKMHSNEKGRTFNLTLQDMKEQWEKQKGICPYTGWELILPKTTTRKDRGPKLPNRASLDRVNPHGTYKPGNIQFVSMMANFAKNEWSESELEKFCCAVFKYRLRDHLHF